MVAVVDAFSWMEKRSQLMRRRKRKLTAGVDERELGSQRNLMIPLYASSDTCSAIRDVLSGTSRCCCCFVTLWLVTADVVVVKVETAVVTIDEEEEEAERVDADRGASGRAC